ncbi:MAG: hypothetical protein ABW211_01575 [Acidimicrobiia bacterium]
MRALRCLLVSLIACAGLVALSPGAVASVPSASKACANYKQLQKDLDKADPSDAKGFDSAEFKKVGAAFKKAAKKSPAKVKDAMNTIASYYNALGGKDNYVEALQEIGKNGQKFSKAIGTYVTYFSTACA